MNRRTHSPIALAALLSMITLAAPAVAQADPPPSRSVSTSGTATVYVVPDLVDVRFSVETFDKDLDAAKKANDQRTSDVLKFIRETLRVEEKHVQTAYANSEAIYEESREYGRRQRGALKGFSVTRSYRVRLTDVKQFPQLVDRMLTDTTVSVEGHSFSSSKAREYRDQARREAVVAAREKAHLLATELGMAIGSPISIDETGGEYSVLSNREMFSGGGGGGDDDDLTPIGQIQMRADVNVKFDLVAR